MDKKICSFLILFCLIFLNRCKDDSSVNKPDGQDFKIGLNSYEKTIVEEIDKYITPLQGSSPHLNDSDLKVFDRFSDAQVIGLGEATHGSKEFFQTKHRLFKYFVEKHGFKIFGFESDMGECIYIDRFITKGTGTIQEMMSRMYFWTWRTDEVKDLILWMKEYNNGKNNSDQIHLLGVDCQTTRYNKSLISEYLFTYDPAHPAYIDTILNKISEIENMDFNLFSTAIFNNYKSKCDSIREYFNTNKNKMEAKSGKFEYDIITRLITQGLQYMDVMYLNATGNRDLYMAENTIWLTTLFGNNTKVVSWAHNFHAGKSFDGQECAQGYYVSNKIGSKYKVIGFSFNQGSFRAVKYDVTTKQYSGLMEHTIDKLPVRESTNYIFHAVEPKDFILIFSSIPSSSSLNQWLNVSRKFLSIGAAFDNNYLGEYYQPTNLMETFDAIIHFQKTTGSAGYKF